MRTVRNLDYATKQKISNAMKLHHEYRSEAQKQATAQKQSDSMRDYWKSIPTKDAETDTEIETQTPPL